MSTKYDLPNSVGKASTITRTLLVWGLPLIGWLLLIGLIWGFGKGETKEAPETSSPAIAETSPVMPPSEAAAKDENVQSTAPAARRLLAFFEESPATEAETSEETPTVVKPREGYDFTNARSTLGLKNEAQCKTGIIVDLGTRQVLWAKNANKRVPIASMTKMMTLLLAEEDILAGRVAREQNIPVTVAAYKIGGSQVWLDPKETFPLHELLKTIAIKSANDSAYLVAEYLGKGDVTAFVARMNKRAAELKMQDSVFYDPHGLGDDQKRHNLSTAYDMVVLGERLLDYPEVMRFAGMRTDTFRNGKLDLRNMNNLVFNRVPGVDGLKTGYTQAAGFCVTFTCLRNGRRLIGCVTGFSSSKERDNFCKALLDWAYAN